MVEGAADALSRICVTCDIELDAEAPEYAKQCRDCFRDPDTKRPCSLCNEPKILTTDPEWKTICGTCYKNSEFRSCRACHKKTILASEPEWRNICSVCYKDESKYRVCTRCGKNSIKPGTKSFIRICGACWVDERKKTHKQCPNCDSKMLDTPLTAEMCRKCRIKKRMCRENVTLGKNWCGST